MRYLAIAYIGTAITLAQGFALAEEPPTREAALRTLRKAAEFFHSEVSIHGGYLWRYSGDLTLREGEGKASKTMIWVQPPGTPTVGQAFLDTYEATGDTFYLDAARDAAKALLRGQLRTGGWFYHIEFDPAKRQDYGYLDVPKHKKQKQKTTLDDDTTQSAVRFLIRLDKILDFKDEQIHKAVTYALESMLRAQFPNGGWYQWWDRYPTPASSEEYPVKTASYPESWSRKWLNDWTGVYFINDELVPNMMKTMLTAYDTYGQDRYLASAEKAGAFLVLAQMPDPQPAWAQQYDRNMHPVWDRKFEPPAITGRESQTVLEALLLLYRRTANRKYLDPVPRAISYLKRSRLADGRLTRFYELKTNRPLYFKRTGKRYDLTYSSDDLPTHYAFIVDSRLDSIEAEYDRLLKTGPASLNAEEKEKAQRLSPTLKAQVRNVISSIDQRGAWVERGLLRHHKVEPNSGVIDCSTFAKNIRTLCRFLTSSK